MGISINLAFCDDGAGTKYVIAEFVIPNYKYEIQNAALAEVGGGEVASFTQLLDKQKPLNPTPLQLRKQYWRADYDWQSGTDYEVRCSPDFNSHPRFQRIAPNDPEAAPVFAVRRQAAAAAAINPAVQLALARTASITEIRFTGNLAADRKIYARIAKQAGHTYTIDPNDFGLWREQDAAPLGAYAQVLSVPFTEASNTATEVWFVASHAWNAERGYEVRGQVGENFQQIEPRTAPANAETDPSD